MIIKIPKVHIPLLSAFFMLVLVMVLSVDKARLKREAFTVIDSVMTQDWGFSSLTGLLGIQSLSEFAQIQGGVIPGLVKIFPDRVLMSVPEIIYTKVRGFPDRPMIDRIDIDIKFKHYQKILDDRKHALDAMMLIDPHEIPAKIRYKNKTYKTKIRLKGDLSGHWRSQVRMSFRAALKGNKTIKGFKRFSLHKPGDRQYPYDQIFQDFVRESGGLAARHDYVRVFVNGQNWGIMNIEEHMSKALLEKQMAKESLILKFGDERKWYYETVTPLPYEHYRLSDRNLFIACYQGGKSLSQPLARSHYSYIVQKLLHHKESDLLDIDSFSRAAFAASVWNNFHTLASANTRFYFNPYTLKIEPITTDQGEFNAIKSKEHPLTHLYAMDSAWLFGIALSSPEGQARFSENLDIVLGAAKKIPEFNDYYHSFFPHNFPIDIAPVMANIEAMQNLTRPGAHLKTKNAQYEKSIPTSQQAARFLDHVHIRHYDDGRLLLFNLLDVPVRLEDILYDGKPLKPSGQSLIPPYTENRGLFVIKTDKKGLHDGRFTAVTSYGGHVRETKTKATLVTDLLNPLERSQTDSLPSYVKRKGADFVIEAGQWRVEYPLLIDGNLTIKPGTHLHFAPDAYLIVKGSLVADGKANAPIIFRPIEKSWKGLYILKAQEQSILHHVIIADTAALQDGLLSLTGGVTFYKSSVLIDHTKITGTIAEDGLNIVKSDFIIKNSLISDMRSDGLDSDFSNGEILSSKIERVGGDALDFSGSTVFIKDVMITNIRDKAVSAGEKSTLTIQDSILTHIGVGIASKDGSIVTADRITVLDYHLHAAMTYIKKDMFGASALYISKLTHDGLAPFSRQKKTKLFVDGHAVRSQKIDIKALYNSEVMRK